MKTDFLTSLKAAGLPAPEPEYVFHPTRKWAFDYCWPDLMVAAEREGLPPKGGRSRHTEHSGYAKDCLKYSEAAILGYRVIRFTTRMEERGEALALVERAIRAAQKERSNQ